MARGFGTIFDLGPSEGNDSAFYLSKGFRVVAVEADPDMVRRLQRRFAAEIADGSLVLLHRAASDTAGERVNFYIHTGQQGASGLTMNPGLDPATYKEPSAVETIDWPSLLAYGRPRYVKIDIENNEERFLAGMAASRVRPQFLSVECHELRPIEALHAMGYERFRLVPQNAPEGFHFPEHQLEGRFVPPLNLDHSSGPFGLDVFGTGDWTGYREIRDMWQASRWRSREGAWFDCHVWKPPRSGIFSRRERRRSADALASSAA